MYKIIDALKSRLTNEGYLLKMIRSYYDLDETTKTLSIKLTVKHFHTDV